MALGEFDLIERYFKRPARRADIGIGDDCALLSTSPDTQLAISSDMLVVGQHFFSDVDPALLGHKALAVNLSDLAACGARPLAFTLALALPEANEHWLAAFSRGLFALAEQHDCELIGGDTTRGPLNICITIFGEVPIVNGRSQALMRSDAKPGDDLYVSGNLGDARLALHAMQCQRQLTDSQLSQVRTRLEQPTPRIALGMALRGVATAAMDVSDGLQGDLGHLLKSSVCGAMLQTDVLQNLMAVDAGLNSEQRLEYVLAGGDDYELLFTAPPSERAAVAEAALKSNTAVTRIGQIESESGLRLVDAQGQAIAIRHASFDHFR